MLLVERSDGKFLVITSLPNDYYISKLVVFYAMAVDGGHCFCLFPTLFASPPYHKIAPLLQTLVQYSMVGATGRSKI